MSNNTVNSSWMPLLLWTITVTGLSTKAFAQTGHVEGTVVDTSLHHPINEASILILNATDSFLVADTRSNRSGAFRFDNIPDGKYLILITYPKYAAYADSFSVDPRSSSINLRELNLQLEAALLKAAVVIARKSAIRLKGDTTEYTADSFHVPPNASVEDLIRQLPGLQVDRNGNITANGKAVAKVLVDGEEFFGDDPTLVTRNLKANMIDKVQLYDKTSDQAAFTGIDDGKKATTLNLKLKENSKHGYFGKIEAGGGTNGFYQNQAMINSFQGKQKIAAWFTLSNTGLIGLDRRSQQSYAGGDSNPIQNDLDNWDGTYHGIGIPKTISGGLHYDNKWAGDKQAINMNYKLGGLDLTGEQNTKTQTNLPGTVLYTTQNQQTKDHMTRQGLNGVYEINPDSSSKLKVTAESSLFNKTVNETTTAETQRENGSILNNSARKTAVDASAKALKSDVLWEKRLNKDRRTLSIDFNASLNNNHSHGFFYTTNNFFNEAGPIDSSQIVDQYKTTNNHASILGLKLAYTEPIDRYGSLIVNYGVVSNNARAEALSLNRSSGNVYDDLDSLYSNNYQFNQFADQGGVAYVFNNKKVRFQFGSDAGTTRYNQQNLFKNASLKRSFTNWYPSAQFRYQFSPSKSISFNYIGNTTQPTIQQIQPLANNIDPLNIYIGNTTLKPTFTNNFSASYQAFADRNSGYLWIRGNLSTTYDPITTSVQTDSSSGKNTYTYLNLTSERTSNYSGNIFYSTKTNVWGIDFGTAGDFSGNTYANVSNSRTNRTTANNYKLSLSLSKQKPNAYYAYLSFGPAYTTNQNSLQPSINNNFWGYRISHLVDVFLPSDFILHSEGEYNWQEKTQAFPVFHRFVWNAWLGKKLLKSKNLLIKLSANDILNQNTGFTRNATNNIIYQTNYTTIARYFMASVIFDFNKTNEKK